VRTVHAETLDGEQLEVQAAKVVVACHAVESARLLMLSRTGNLDHVGHNLMEHWYTGARGFNTRGRSYPGQLGFNLLESTAYYDAPSDGPVTGAIKLEFNCGGEPLVALNSAEDAKWGRDLAEFDDREFGRWLTAAVETEQMPNPNSRVSLDDTRKDLFGDPVPNVHFAFTGRDTETQKRARRVAETVLEAAGAKDLVRLGRSIASHHMGTCRMSAREEDGVVDQNLKVWGSDNLFVLGSSVFPTGGALQPTLTIAALAMRLAAHFHASA
jgi:choline dehydrogenase-like flavoprotein